MAPSTLDRHPSSFNFIDETVEIIVGSGNTKNTFWVPKALLCFYSDYFKAALMGKFLEANDGVVELASESPKTFRMVVYWMYTRRLSEPGHVDTNLGWNDIVALWIFGDAHQIPLLQNEAMNVMQRKVHALWQNPASSINMVYANTPAGSLLRKFAIDIIAKTTNAASCNSSFLEYNFDKEALIDLIGVIWCADPPTLSKKQVEDLDMCQYHVHERGVTCGTSTAPKKTPAKESD